MNLRNPGIRALLQALITIRIEPARQHLYPKYSVVKCWHSISNRSSTNEPTTLICSCRARLNAWSRMFQCCCDIGRRVHTVAYDLKHDTTKEERLVADAAAQVWCEPETYRTRVRKNINHITMHYSDVRSWEHYRDRSHEHQYTATLVTDLVMLHELLQHLWWFLFPYQGFQKFPLCTHASLVIQAILCGCNFILLWLSHYINFTFC